MLMFYTCVVQHESHVWLEWLREWFIYFIVIKFKELHVASGYSISTNLLDPKQMGV